MSFRDYVRQRRITNDLAGDFVIIARVDVDMPDAETWEELKDYLELQSAAPSIIESAHRVWRGYLMARVREAEPEGRASKRAAVRGPVASAASQGAPEQPAPGCAKDRK